MSSEPSRNDEDLSLIDMEEPGLSQVYDFPNASNDQRSTSFNQQSGLPPTALMPPLQPSFGPLNPYDSQDLSWNALNDPRATFSGPHPSSFPNQQLPPVPAPRPHQAQATTIPSHCPSPAPSTTAMTSFQPSLCPPGGQGFFMSSIPMASNNLPLHRLPDFRTYDAPMANGSWPAPAGRRTLLQNTQLRSPVTTPGDRHTIQRVTKTRSSNEAPAARGRGAAKAPRKRFTKGRELMRWNVGHDQMLALAMELEIQQQGLNFDWDAVGQHLGKKSTGEAIKQHLIKVRGWRTKNDQPNPPQFFKKGRRGDKSKPKTRGPDAQPPIKREYDDAEENKDDYSEYEETSTQSPLPKKFKMGDSYRVEDLTRTVYDRGLTAADGKKAKSAKALAENVAKNKKKAGRKQRSKQGQKTLPGAASVPDYEETGYEDIGIPDFAHQSYNYQAAGHQALALGHSHAHPGTTLPDQDDVESPITSEEAIGFFNPGEGFQNIPRYVPDVDWPVFNTPAGMGYPLDKAPQFGFGNLVNYKCGEGELL